jgi:hypothetical protein
MTKLYTFTEAVLDAGTLPLWSHVSLCANVLNELSFCMTWVPQRVLHKHTATGWFVSLGGWNSVREALSLFISRPHLRYVAADDGTGFDLGRLPLGTCSQREYCRAC